MLYDFLPGKKPNEYYKWQYDSSVKAPGPDKFDPSPLARRVGLKIVVKSLLVDEPHARKKQRFLKQVLIISVSASNVMIYLLIGSMKNIILMITKKKFILNE